MIGVKMWISGRATLSSKHDNVTVGKYCFFSRGVVSYIVSQAPFEQLKGGSKRIGVVKWPLDKRFSL